MGGGTLQNPLLDIEKNGTTTQEQFQWRDSEINKNKSRRTRIAIVLFLFLFLLGISGFIFSEQFPNQETKSKSNDKDSVATSENGVVAADHEKCSEIGANVLGLPGGTAVDAAVAVAFCLGVVNPTSSGIGGGAFMVVGSSTGSATTYDMRETAPLKASQDMFKGKEAKRLVGPLSIAVPGEVAGLYKAWKAHGSVPWKQLVEPSIKLAREGFEVGSHLAYALRTNKIKIKNDPGLKSVFTNGEELLKKGDKCYNPKLAETLEAVAKDNTRGFYEGDVARNLTNDVKVARGIMTIEDLWSYEVNVTKAMVVEDVMGYKIQGMWPPSSGTTGFAMVMNVLAEYKKGYATNDKHHGLHRVIEAIKFMLAARMDLGDPVFVNGTANVVNTMVSKSYAKRIQDNISDEETFLPEHYLSKYRQLEDQGTSHFCVVDKDRNVVSMTTTVNYAFGSGFMSPSTGIILNNQMADFSIPTENSSNSLPPAPANYIAPKKRPLSSMMPLIITKDNELVGVIGASGGIYIIPAVIQVFLNHFILKMSPLEAVKCPRVYHKLKPNEVLYEDWEVYNGEHIKLNEDTRDFLKLKGHKLKGTNVGATVQLVVQEQEDSKRVLTAVSDLRKGGKPAAANAAPTPAPVF